MIIYIQKIFDGQITTMVQSLKQPLFPVFIFSPIHCSHLGILGFLGEFHDG